MESICVIFAVKTIVNMRLEIMEQLCFVYVKNVIKI